jgi:hypothetical protein
VSDERRVVRLTLEIDVDRGRWLAATCAWPPVPPPGYPAAAPWPPPGAQQEILDDVVDNLASDVAGWALSTLQCQTIVDDGGAQLRLVDHGELTAASPQVLDKAT